ncbi:MAG: hypothetical protein CL878_06770 [Dehalococcoidia bacterium]|nr:hypothetical protein [Dehalococcoidia bacterium]
MIVRKYRATDMAAAVRQIREDLGSDAVIIHSQQVRDGWMGLFGRRQVEVVAAIEDTENRVEAAPAAQPAAVAVAPPVEQPTAAPPADPVPTRSEPEEQLPATATVTATSPDQEQDTEAERRSEAAEAPATTLATKSPRKAAVPAVTRPEPAVTAAMREMRSNLRDLRGTVERLAHQGSAPAVEGSPILRGIYEHLLNHELDPSLALDVVSEAGASLTEETAQDLFAIRTSVAEQLQRRLPVGGPLISEPTNGTRSPATPQIIFSEPTNGTRSPATPQIIFLVGPTGVGKTTTIAKLIAHYVLDRSYRVGLLSTDTYRIGATSQLDTYANIMGQALTVAYAPDELAAAVAGMSEYTLLLVDTPGCAQQNEAQIEELATFIASVPERQVHLCISSSTKLRDLMDIAGGFGRLSIDRIILTKLDETTIYGPIVSFVHRRQTPVSYLTTGQQVPEDLEVATAERLADLVLEDV